MHVHLQVVTIYYYFDKEMGLLEASTPQNTLNSSFISSLTLQPSHHELWSSRSLDVSVAHLLFDGNCEPKMDKSYADEEIDHVESGELELKKLHKDSERDCRICHLSLFTSRGIGECDQLQDHSTGMAIELGCSCKGDLASAHKHCADTWFKTKGNTICEICGTNALNIAGEQTNGANNATVATVAAPVVLSETRDFWHGRRVMNFLLASMLFAFVISWLFHFNILP